MDLATWQLALSDRATNVARTLWHFYSAAVTVLVLITTLVVLSLGQQTRLPREISSDGSVSPASFRGQPLSLHLAIVVLGIAGAVFLTVLLILALRSLRQKRSAMFWTHQQLQADSKSIALKASPAKAEDAPTSAERYEATARSNDLEEAWMMERIELLRRVREQARELVFAHEKISRAARSKDEFIASMSHELRSPLHAVIGLSEALRDEVHGTLSNQQRKFLRNIEESGRHLLGLINDVIEIARAGTEQMRLDLAPVSVADVCYSSMATIADLAHRKGLALETRLDPRVELIQADEQRFRKILVSLLSNAVKFTPRGGKIGLEVAGDAAGGVVKFTVWDSGIGIAQQDIQRIFRPFVQTDGRFARQYEGTGLGLTLAYQLTDLHCGGMHVQSSPHQGSRFVVMVPWPAKVVKTPESSCRSSLGGKPSVLLLAQNKLQIDCLTATLEAMGMRVVVVENSRQAMAQARQELPTLVLLKVGLSGVEDLEFVQAIRDEPRLRHLPVIAITALSVPEERERCLAAGIDDFLVAPLRNGELQAAVQNLLGSTPRRQKQVFYDPSLELQLQMSAEGSRQSGSKCRSNTDAA